MTWDHWMAPESEISRFAREGRVRQPERVQFKARTHTDAAWRKLPPPVPRFAPWRIGKGKSTPMPRLISALIIAGS